MVTESLFKFGFSCRIDTLANDNGLFIKYNCLGIGRNDRAVLLFRHLHWDILCQFYHGMDVIWCCTTAAAGDHSAHSYNLFHHSSKVFWIYVIYGLSIFTSWKSCIWVNQDRGRRNFQDIFYDPLHLFRSQTAVYAQNVYSQTF